MIGTHEFGGASWMWFVTACVAVEVGCAWVPKCGHGNWMWLVPTSLMVPVGCG